MRTRPVGPGLAGWPGTDAELVALFQAAERHCQCRHIRGSGRACGAHALLGDERVLRRLVFARRIAASLVREELEADGAPPLAAPAA